MKRSRMRRRWLWWFTVPAVLVCLSVGIRLIYLITGTNAAADMYRTEQFTDAAQGYERQTHINVVDPWKAHYNQGTALIQASALPDLEGAVDALEAAYSLVSSNDPVNQCLVQTNLALAHEIIGDRAYTPTASESARDAAKTAYQKALSVRQRPGCPQSTVPDQEKNDDVIQRLEDKIADIQQSEQPKESDPSPSPSPSSEDKPQDPDEEQRQQALKELKDKSERQAYNSQSELNSLYNRDDYVPRKW